MAVRRWAVAGAALAFTVGNLASGILPASAASIKTFKIGVDNTSPAGHNFLYVDYFPRAGVKVHRGDIVDFSWNTGSPDGAHTVSFGTPQPFVIPDGDDGPAQLEANPAVFAPSNPTCGSQASPCDYNGSGRLASGFAPTAPGFDFFVKMDLPASTQVQTVNFFCELHPGMSGSLLVVPDSADRSSAAQVERAAAVQYRTDTAGALDAERTVEEHSVSTNASGQKTVNVIAGTATQFVEVAEMLPRNVKIAPNDNITWTTHTIKDVHTVTFPAGAGSNSVDPLMNVCEAAPGDTPALGGPFSCGNPANFETHLNPQPQGGNVISSPQTVATSGLIPSPFGNSFTFSFPNGGTFTYQCRIHDHMQGTVNVT